jgi:hypothetical protein
MAVDPTTGRAAEELAKATGKAIDLVRDVGSFASKVLGTVPEDAVGFFGGDRLHHARIRNEWRLAQRTEEIISARRVEQTAPVSPSLAIPLVHSARDESRPELQELWARLLANAMDPARAGDLRLEFIEAVRRFHPRDALILQKMGEQPGHLSPNTRDFFAGHLKLSQAAIEVSFANLVETKCVSFNSATPQNFYLTAFGREFLAACRL